MADIGAEAADADAAAYAATDNDDDDAADTEEEEEEAYAGTCAGVVFAGGRAGPAT